jgi:hypothetical protein
VRKLVLIAMVVMMASVAFADQEIKITVPDSFTEADITYVKELANVAKGRIILKPITPSVALVTAAKEKIDEYRVKDALTTKYKVVEEVVEPKAPNTGE